MTRACLDSEHASNLKTLKTIQTLQGQHSTDDTAQTVVGPTGTSRATRWSLQTSHCGDKPPTNSTAPSHLSSLGAAAGLRPRFDFASAVAAHEDASSVISISNSLRSRTRTRQHKRPPPIDTSITTRLHSRKLVDGSLSAGPCLQHRQPDMPTLGPSSALPVARPLERSSTAVPSPVKLEPGVTSRPEQSYMELIIEAIESSPCRMMSLQEIYEHIKARYVYFQNAPPTWQNSIRHNLSVQRLFEKKPRPQSRPGKGGLWTIAENARLQISSQPYKRPRCREADESDSPQRIHLGARAVRTMQARLQLDSRNSLDIGSDSSPLFRSHSLPTKLGLQFDDTDSDYPSDCATNLHLNTFGQDFGTHGTFQKGIFRRMLDAETDDEEDEDMRTLSGFQGYRVTNIDTVGVASNNAYPLAMPFSPLYDPRLDEKTLFEATNTGDSSRERRNAHRIESPYMFVEDIRAELPVVAVPVP
eukprot:jgi/Hompol1/750/HPOL_000536-RA